MIERVNKNVCGFEGDIISYIYGELTADGRERFESHLMDCTGCTDDFAAISYARYSVFEYHREEFAHLPTPQILIPYAHPQNAAAKAEQSGLFSGLAGLMSGWRIGFAVASLVLIGLAMLGLNYSIPVRTNVAVNDSAYEATTLPPEKEQVVQVKTVDKPAAGVPVLTPQVTGSRVPISKRSTRTNAKSDEIRDRQFVAIRSITASSKTKAPVLSGYDDNDDRSLRLSDLFDNEVGIRH
jgi:anti-sigma factor RsiW